MSVSRAGASQCRAIVTSHAAQDCLKIGADDFRAPHDFLMSMAESPHLSLP
jgi:hypothetical protein